MQTKKFESWPRNIAGLPEVTIRARLSNCRTLERYEGDLDSYFDKNRLEGLLARLAYSTEDERRGARQPHRVPINGSIRNGTATLKSAAALYKEFRESGGQPNGHRTQVLPRRNSRRSGTPAKD